MWLRLCHVIMKALSVKWRCRYRGWWRSMVILNMLLPGSPFWISRLLCNVTLRWAGHHSKVFPFLSYGAKNWILVIFGKSKMIQGGHEPQKLDLNLLGHLVHSDDFGENFYFFGEWIFRGRDSTLAPFCRRLCLSCFVQCLVLEWSRKTCPLST